jgi:hypothetical protein
VLVVGGDKKRQYFNESFNWQSFKIGNIIGGYDASYKN